MKIFEKLKKLLKALYRSGYIEKKTLDASDESVVDRITRKMELEREQNDRKIHDLNLNKILSKNNISRKKK